MVNRTITCDFFRAYSLNTKIFYMVASEVSTVVLVMVRMSWSMDVPCQVHSSSELTYAKYS